MLVSIPTQALRVKLTDTGSGLLSNFSRLLGEGMACRCFRHQDKKSYSCASSSPFRLAHYVRRALGASWSFNRAREFLSTGAGAGAGPQSPKNSLCVSVGPFCPKDIPHRPGTAFANTGYLRAKSFWNGRGA